MPSRRSTGCDLSNFARQSAGGPRPTTLLSYSTRCTLLPYYPMLHYGHMVLFLHAALRSPSHTLSSPLTPVCLSHAALKRQVIPVLAAGPWGHSGCGGARTATQGTAYSYHKSCVTVQFDVLAVYHLCFFRQTHHVACIKVQLTMCSFLSKLVEQEAAAQYYQEGPEHRLQQLHQVLTSLTHHRPCEEDEQLSLIQLDATCTAQQIFIEVARAFTVLLCLQDTTFTFKY